MPNLPSTAPQSKQPVCNKPFKKMVRSGGAAKLHVAFEVVVGITQLVIEQDEPLRGLGRMQFLRHSNVPSF